MCIWISLHQAFQRENKWVQGKDIFLLTKTCVCVCMCKCVFQFPLTCQSRTGIIPRANLKCQDYWKECGQIEYLYIYICIYIYIHTYIYIYTYNISMHWLNYNKSPTVSRVAIWDTYLCYKNHSIDGAVTYACRITGILEIYWNGI